MAQKFSKPFYNSKRWKNTREYILKRDRYLCVQCGEPASEVHHVIHLNSENIDDLNISIGEGNLISLCKDCHIKIHMKGEEVDEEYMFDGNGYIVEVCPRSKSS